MEGDLRRGDGDELGGKFCALHSSSALAVNTFGPFKRRPSELRLLNRDGAESVEFEKKLRIFRGGKAPNIDVWVDRGDEVVAIESKCLEYLTPKRPHFSPAYDRLARVSDPRWWAAYVDAKRGKKQHFDCAQLIKHYFGLNVYQSKKGMLGRRITLVYLFWEPLNWQSVEECRRHKSELGVFARGIEGADVEFRWMTHTELWDEWATVPVLEEHAQRLKGRYQVFL